MRPYQICCITYKQLDVLVRLALEQQHDPELEITIVEGLQEEIIAGLAAAEKTGCEVVIGGGANAKIAQEYCGIPVLGYGLTAYDYLDAVDRAFTLGKKICIVTFRSPIAADLRIFLERRGIGFTNLIYETGYELCDQMSALQDHVIIGAAHAVDMAVQFGIPNVLIYPGQSTILKSLRDAKMLAKQLRRQSERSKFAQAVVEHSSNGLLYATVEGEILEFNPSAQQMFGKAAAFVIGHSGKDAVPESGIHAFCLSDETQTTEVRHINGYDVLANWVRVRDRGGAPIGTLGIFSNLSDIKRAQIEYLHKAHSNQVNRGFVAKKRFRHIIGDSMAVKAIKEEARLMSHSEASVLLSGETGVGKELFAQSIHNEGSRKSGPFVAVNCAALPEQLLESELFGYDEGAFTGGRRGGKKGLFELADNGSIFLDEIGEISPALQSRLLRVLQEGEIMHVGGERITPVNVRVISATNRDLEHMDFKGFRRDLFYRLSVLELRIPPLRERSGDPALLFSSFLKRYGDVNLHLQPLPVEVNRVLETYTWPGNIRELENVCERFVLYLSYGNERGVKFLRRCIVRAIGEKRLFENLLQTAGYPQNEVDSDLIKTIQEIMGYNKTQVGDRLGISRSTLWRIER